mgnify:CR=1 FL=1
MTLIATSSHSDLAVARELQPYRSFPPQVSGLTLKVLSFAWAGHCRKNRAQAMFFAIAFGCCLWIEFLGELFAVPKCRGI